MTLDLIVKILSFPAWIFAAIFAPLAILVGINDLIEEWKWRHKK